jgi:hypothetical protein
VNILGDRVGCECGKEKGREFDSGLIPLLGEWGAYISESCDNSAGDVKAENILRMLSHCVCVVCKQEYRATRTCEAVNVGFGGLCNRLENLFSQEKNGSKGKTYDILSSLSNIVTASWTTDCHIWFA